MTLHQTLALHSLDCETVLLKVGENPLDICLRHEQSSPGSTPRTVSPTRVEFPREEPTLLRAQWNKDIKKQRVDVPRCEDIKGRNTVPVPSISPALGSLLGKKEKKKKKRLKPAASAPADPRSCPAQQQQQHTQ